MAITLSRCSSPSIRSCAPGLPMPPFRSRRSASTRMSLTSELLPEPRDAGDADERAQRDLDVDVLEVVVRGAADDQPFFADAAGAAPGPRSAACPERYWPVRLSRLRRMIGSTGPVGHDLAAAHAGPGAEVDDVVGRPHRVFVVLDDDHRVAQVAQPGQGGQQAVVVARVQADRRLVEDVQHADQPAADLAGQADALHLAAGERRRGAVEREVVQADVAQEAQPAADLLEHFGGDRLAGLVELQRLRRTPRPRRPPGRRPRAAIARGDRRNPATPRRSSRPGPAGSAAGRRIGCSRARACTFPAGGAAGGSCVLRYCESSLGMMPSNVPPYLCPTGRCAR